MPHYSVQELIDCSVEDGKKNGNNCNGCNGGSLTCGFEYVKNHGLSDYNKLTAFQTVRGSSTRETLFSSYKAIQGTCARSNDGPLIKNYANYYKDVKADDIKDWLYSYGPIAIGINAASPSFQFYKRGIYDDSSCSVELNHAVMLVGYGTENGKDYWIIKNSWGSKWGESGFLRLPRGKSLCGVEDYGAFAYE